MADYHLISRIENASRILCELSSKTDETLYDPILCFSLQAPGIIKSGGKKIDGLGGFTVLQLSGTLRAGFPIAFELAFEDPYFWISNRAWHPQGPYLRHPDGHFPNVSMNIELGVKTTAPPAPSLPEDGLGLVPAPVRWRPATGTRAFETLKITGAFENIGKNVDSLCLRRGLRPIQGTGPTLRILTDASLSEDEYRLRIDDEIELTAATEGGAFYGLITLVSLRELHAGLVPHGTIEDAPRFEWRGFMLDCAREYYPPEAIKKLLDLMALLKLNRFHWHFADDEAFRLEVDCAPRLWKQSAFRGEGQVLPGLFGGGASPRGGRYSKDIAAQIVAHAKGLNIEVLPEIEVPAHALALTKIYPDIRDLGDTGPEASVQGYVRNVVNPAQDATWGLLEPLALEVASLFPFGHLHLGGDELPDQTWAGSPLADKYKQKHGLKTHEDVEGHILNRLAGGLKDAGFTPCAWQEAGDGSVGIGHDAILFSWTGAEPGKRAISKGYKVVMCPAQHCYFDMAHSMDPDDWGANWAANFALDQTINWDPVPEDTKEDAHKIIGVQGTFWSEFTSEFKQVEPMVAPRILGLATMGWSQKGAVDLNHLRASATCYMPLFERIGWAAHGGAIMMDTPPEALRRADN